MIENIKVLLTEDNILDATLMQENLAEVSPWHFEVDYAGKLEHAFHNLSQEKRYDVILLDLSLPDSFGLETVSRMREAAPHIPIVVLTGLDDEMLGIEALRAGAQDYLVKGQTDSRLLGRAIRYAIERKNLEDMLRQARDQLELRYREKSADLEHAVETLHEETLERLQVQDALSQSRQAIRELAAIVQCSADAIFRQTRDGLITSWNGGAEAIFGYTSREIIGKHCQLLFPPDRREDLQRVLASFAAGEKVENYEAICQDSSGERINIGLSFSSITDASNKVVAMAVVGRDIRQRKRLENEVMQISEKERQRIGRDLHDMLGQNLAGISFLSTVLKQKLTSRGVEEAADAAVIANYLNETVAMTRSLARGLCPVELKADGLMTALQELASNSEQLFRGIKCRFSCDHTVLLHNSAAATHLYRIAQEAINNSVRHGHAHNIELCLSSDSHGISLSIDDDGCGISSASLRNSGMGLRIMDYRAKAIGGTLAVAPRSEGGTRVACRVFSGQWDATHTTI